MESKWSQTRAKMTTFFDALDFLEICTPLKREHRLRRSQGSQNRRKIAWNSQTRKVCTKIIKKHHPRAIFHRFWLPKWALLGETLLSFSSLWRPWGVLGSTFECRSAKGDLNSPGLWPRACQILDHWLYNPVFLYFCSIILDLLIMGWGGPPCPWEPWIPAGSQSESGVDPRLRHNFWSKNTLKIT